MPSSPDAVPTVVLALPESLVSTALATALQARCGVVAVVQSWNDFEDALAEHSNPPDQSRRIREVEGMLR